MSGRSQASRGTRDPSFRLPRQLAPVQFLALSVATMSIFVTIFGSYGPLAVAAGSGLIFVFFFAALVAIPNAVVFAHMSTLFPQAGAGYTIVKSVLGKTLGTTFLLIQIVVWLSISAVLADEGAGLIHGEWPAVSDRLMTVVFIALMFGIAVLAVHRAGAVSTLLLALELAFLLFWIIFGATHVRVPFGDILTFPPRFLATHGHMGKVIGFSAFVTAIPLGVFYVDGYEWATSFTEETANYRSVRRGVVTAAIIALVAYIIGFPMLILTDPHFQQVAASSFPGATVLKAVLPAAAPILVVWAAISAFNGGLSIYLEGSRLIFAGARDGRYGPWASGLLAKTTSRGVPIGATILWLVPTLIIGLVTSLDKLFDFTSVMLLIDYIGLSASAIWLYVQIRDKIKKEGAFRWFPLVPGAVIVFSLALLALQPGFEIGVALAFLAVAFALAMAAERSLSIPKADEIETNSQLAGGPIGKAAESANPVNQ
jgi:amino acid transporter